MSPSTLTRILTELSALFRKYDVTIWTRKWYCCGQGYNFDLYAVYLKRNGVKEARDFSSGWGLDYPIIWYGCCSAPENFDSPRDNFVRSNPFLQELRQLLEKWNIGLYCESYRSLGGDYDTDALAMQPTKECSCGIVEAGGTKVATATAVGPLCAETIDSMLGNMNTSFTRSDALHVLSQISKYLKKHGITISTIGGIDVFGPAGTRYHFNDRENGILSAAALRRIVKKETEQHVNNQ